MFTNISAYEFIPIPEKNLSALQTKIKNKFIASAIKGTVYLAQEGINVAASGKENAIIDFIDFFQKETPFQKLFFKKSFSEFPVFSKVIVKVKPEIIALGIDELDIINEEKTYISPKTLKNWLDQEKNFMLIDTRNNYEYEAGSFSKALNPHIDTFKDFPAFVEKLPAEAKEKPVVVFCTGGVRCEKVVPLMQAKGFQSVYQLHGGILHYFEICGGEHWDGDCFVFDDRVSVDPVLQSTGAAVCKSCHRAVKSTTPFPPKTKLETCPHCQKEEL